MTPAEIIETLSAGMCHSPEKRGECRICQRKLLAIEAVRLMGMTMEALSRDASMACEEPCESCAGCLYADKVMGDAPTGGDS